MLTTMELIMAIKGVSWNDEYRKKFYSSEKVQAHLETFIEQAKQPKTVEQREKMSIAKRGRTYSEQHKHNMSEAQKFRQALRKEIEANDPQLPREQVWIKVREESKQW